MPDTGRRAAAACLSGPQQVSPQAGDLPAVEVSVGEALHDHAAVVCRVAFADDGRFQVRSATPLSY